VPDVFGLLFGLQLLLGSQTFNPGCFAQTRPNSASSSHHFISTCLYSSSPKLWLYDLTTSPPLLVEYALVLGEIENYWLTFYFILCTHILLPQRDDFAWGKKQSNMSELVYLHANV